MTTALVACLLGTRGVRADEVRPTGSNAYQMVTGDDSEEDRKRWDTLYNTRAYVFGKEPAGFLYEHIELLPVGRSLDIASGEGRNAVYLAKKGFIVDAVDISEVGLRKAKRLAHENHVSINTINADLTTYAIKPDTYDVIVNIDYLQRSLIPQIKRGLKHKGVVVFEDHTVDQLNNAQGKHLRRDELLGKGELKELFKDFQILLYRESNDGKDAWASSGGSQAMNPYRRHYREIASVFFRLGVFGFGGPIATMAMMEQETVAARAWLSPDEFSEVYAVCKLLPGPVATQMAIYLGRIRGGVWGGLISGGLFILPCFVMVLGLSMIYADTGAVKSLGSVLSGLQAAALAIIVLSTWNLSKPYRDELRAWGIFAVSGVIIYFRPGVEPLVILAFGLLGAFGARAASKTVSVALLAGAIFAGKRALASSIFAMPRDPAVLGKLFWMCLKAGLFVFGTGLAVVPVLEADAVSKYHWLTHSQFMDGLAVGQVTPGPVTITSTFIGYFAARFPGAIVATVGMFLPSFINVLYLVPRVWRKFSGTPAARGFSSFAIPAVIGGILGTTLKLGLMTVTSWQVAIVFVASLAASVLFRLPSWLLIPVAGVVAGLLAWV